MIIPGELDGPYNVDKTVMVLSYWEEQQHDGRNDKPGGSRPLPLHWPGSTQASVPLLQSLIQRAELRV